METAHSSFTLINIYQPTRRQKPENNKLLRHHCGYIVCHYNYTNFIYNVKICMWFLICHFTFTWPCIVTCDRASWHVTVHRNKVLCNKNQLDALISQIYFGRKFCMFRTVPLSIIRSLFAVHSAIVYVIQVCRQLLSRSICSCSDGQRNCPKHAEFPAKINLWN
jgi:hypothetical protein